MWVRVNVNPLHHRVGDCAIRAISMALDQPWEETYMGVAIKGLEMADMPSGNHIWGAYLKDNGFSRHLVPDTDGIYTVEDFANDHQEGTYILALEGHVVCVKDGNYLDSWDSGHEVPLFYWTKNNEKDVI